MASPTINLNDLLPAAPANGLNISWQSSTSSHTPTIVNTSAYVKGDGVVTHFLRGDGTWQPIQTMGASGASHAAGIAPDPGSTPGSARFLREDATWAAPPTAPPTNAPPGTLHSWVPYGASTALATGTMLGMGVFAGSGTIAQVGSPASGNPAYATLTSATASTGEAFDSNNSQFTITLAIFGQINFYAGLASTASGGYWFGFRASGVSLNTANPNGSVVGFRFIQGTDTHWQAYVGTTSAAGHFTAVDTGITPDTNFHQFAIKQDASGNLTFYIDGSLVASIASGTAGIPASTTRMAATIFNYVGSGTVVTNIASMSWWSNF